MNAPVPPPLDTAAAHDAAMSSAPMDNRSVKPVLVIISAVLALTVLGVIGYSTYVSRAPSERVDTSRQEQPLPTAVPPLRDVPFPSEAVTYPPSWPDNLRYPTEFVLVEATSASLPNAHHGWGAKLRFDGAPHQAGQTLSETLKNKGWTVASYDLDSGGVLLEVERNDGNSGGGTINIDAAEGQPATSNVLSTIEE